MALTGKTIGQLTYLSEVTTDTLFPVELSGDTYHIAYSAFTNSNYNTGTYEELYSLYTGGTLTAGSYYLMTDYQTCYDQPNYDSTGNPITTGNYKTGTTEPLLLLATSTTGFSPTVFSTVYTKDKITYDITWNETEVTSSLAKGRITERIDEANNRADYDFRGVQFIRYVGYYSTVTLPGKVNLNSGTGEVSGTNTFFTNNFSVGDVVGIFYGDSNNGPISAFEYYEVTQIDNDTQMTVSGRTLNGISDTYYSTGNQFGDYYSPFQCNITGGTNDGFLEYYTFDDNYNTYLGDNVNYNTFILSNNVFIGGEYENNTFGGNVIGNTFDDDMDSNTFGPYCQFNIITNDFDDNTIGPFFQKNIIECDMQGNTIGYNFSYNTLGDDDGYDFDFNNVGSNFLGNFFTFTNDDFANNLVGHLFTSNIINSRFENNTIKGNFNNNYLSGSDDFVNNTIGQSFYGNIINADFENNNVIGSFYDNVIETNCRNNTFSNEFDTLTIYDADSNNTFQNNNFTYSTFSTDLTLSGGTGGNPILYSQYSTNVMVDSGDNNSYVTFLSGGTIVVETTIVL